MGGREAKIEKAPLEAFWSNHISFTAPSKLCVISGEVGGIDV